MWIRNEYGIYVQAINGVCFVSWVCEIDKAYAMVFPACNISKWLSLLEDMTGESLTAVVPDV